MAATTEDEQATETPPESDATRPPSDTFRYATWVHTRPGAGECPQRETGCASTAHFHAWVRLPNQFQHQDIRERALAAKARRARQLRDPESDVHEILEGDLAELGRDPNARALMIDELAGKDWWRRRLEAMADVEERDEFKTVERDRERMAELRALPEDKRPADEFSELERHLEAFAEASDKRYAELETPVREAIEGLSDDELLAQLREERIAADASAAFMDVYAKWQMLAGTYTTEDPAARKRVFTDMEQLLDVDADVLEALRLAFADLESSLHRGQRGN